MTTHNHGIPAVPSAALRSEPGRTVRWRRSQLLAAGYDELSARRLAADPDVDVHALLNLADATEADRSAGLGSHPRGLPS